MFSAGDKVPSLGTELKQQQQQRRGERRERERKEIEHGFRVEIAEVEDRYEAEKQQILQTVQREKVRQCISAGCPQCSFSPHFNGQALVKTSRRKAV